MNDSNIIEEREFLIKQIKKKEHEWDVYRKKYAGAPEFWQVQKNAYNEIEALKAYLAKLPSTSAEKRKKIVKWSIIVGVIFSLISIVYILMVIDWSSTEIAQILSHITIWASTALIITFFYWLFKYTTEYVDTSFTLFESIEIERDSAYFYIFFVIVLVSLIACNLFVPEISAWTSTAWISWIVTSIMVTLVIFVFYLLFGLKLGVVLPCDAGDIIFLSLTVLPIFIIFKMSSVMLL